MLVVEMRLYAYMFSSKQRFGLCIILLCIPSKNYSRLFYSIFITAMLALGIYNKFGYVTIRRDQFDEK